MTKTLIAVIGPTAIGKTALAIELATYFKTDIISADSRQFFKEMKIGTAVPSEEELNCVPHHFIQHKSIHEPYSVGDFEREALARLNTLFFINDVVILVGGSGLYVDALVNGLDIFPKADTKIRQELNAQLESNGLKFLQNKLKALDFDYYQKVDLENPHRIIRALEVCIATGKAYSSFLDKTRPLRDFKTIYVGITADRAVIYDRINLRVEKMIEDGLVEEAKLLLPKKKLNALQTVGYKELFDYFEGKCSLEVAISEIKKNTRRFAKRQLTWYRKNDTILWFNYQEDLKSIIEKIDTRVSNEA